VVGLSGQLTHKLINSKDYFVAKLNEITKTHPAASNICEVAININYKDGLGELTIKGYYDIYAFWNSPKPQNSFYVDLYLPYSLASIGADYLQRVAMLENDRRFLDFKIKVVLKKDKSNDFMAFNILSTPNFRNILSVEFGRITVHYLGRTYYVEGRSEQHLLYPNKSLGLDGKKNGNYYFYKFCETN